MNHPDSGFWLFLAFCVGCCAYSSEKTEQRRAEAACVEEVP